MNTTSGVPPDLRCFHILSSSEGAFPPLLLTYSVIAEEAPFRYDSPSISTPLMRVWAVNELILHFGKAVNRIWYFFFASTTMLLPSGVSSVRMQIMLHWQLPARCVPSAE